MATRRAVQNGNWSDTATWNGGVLPGNGDTVYANNFAVTIDQNVTIGGTNNPSVNAGSFVSGQYYRIDVVGTTNFAAIGATANTVGVTFLATGAGSGTGSATALATITTIANSSAGAAAGGGFSITTAYTFNCDIRAGTTTCLTVTATGTLVLGALYIFGGSTSSAFGVQYNSTGTLSLASLNIFGSAAGAHAINNANIGSIDITSSILTGGTNGSHAINNASSGSVTITSSTINAGGGSGATTPAISNASTGSVTITSSTISGGSATSSIAINNASTGSVTITSSTLIAGSASGSSAINNSSTGGLTCSGCTFTATAAANAVSATNSGADVRLSGNFYDHWSGWKAINSAKWRLQVAPTLGETRYALDGTTNSYVTQYGADYGVFGNPATSDVRAGVVYAAGSLTGTCAVPPANAVAFSVPVDNTSGTAVLTPSAVWNALTSGMTTSGSIGERLKNAATVTTTGQQLSDALST